jgi:hypothetical protein
MSSKISKILLLFAVSVISAAPAVALPFKTTPSSFTSYLNSLSWKDGKRRVFSGIGNCKTIEEDWMYACQIAYVTIFDPVRGKLFCEVGYAFGDYRISYNAGSGLRVGNAYPCRSM